ncbi:hypothetical protein AB0G55_22995 [Streptomyces toyocaensis]|uniref:hypothetical protein n=1 Tax=Streptomyces toyocaensis TaxID=55952 RepID=UPI0012FEC82E|nr:hypothetical protein [Streptomyces toyocaensis]
MPHVDPTHLVELALGNGVSHDDASALQHIAVCPSCWEELSLMTRIVDAARGIEEPDLPTAPPDRVWQRITEELACTRTPAAPAPAAPLCGHRPASTSPRTGPVPDARQRRAGVALGLASGLAALWWWHRTRSARCPARDG